MSKKVIFELEIYSHIRTLYQMQNSNRASPNDYLVSNRRFTALSNIFLLNALNE